MLRNERTSERAVEKVTSCGWKQKKTDSHWSDERMSANCLCRVWFRRKKRTQTNFASKTLVLSFLFLDLASKIVTSRTHQCEAACKIAMLRHCKIKYDICEKYRARTITGCKNLTKSPLQGKTLPFPLVPRFWVFLM